MELRVDPHPLIDVRAFVSRFTPDLGAFAGRSPLGGPAPGLEPPDDGLRAAVRDLLRHAGFKPTGRSKPSSEYLVRAHAEGALRPINFAVDAGNWLSLHSGLPISVVDLDRLSPPLRIGPAPEGARYAFNPAGQEIDVGRLLCLHDVAGPTANAVKDAQRTKTGDATRATLNIVWSSRSLAARTDAALAAYRSLLTAAGVQLEPVTLLGG